MSGQIRRYKAFISYSHAADGDLAPALQSALHRFARPWYSIRAVHVFRDQSNLSTSPALWSSVQQALIDSEYFILLASPGAAMSKWVRKEIDFWLSHRSPKTLLIVLTGGDIGWNDTDSDFDWDKTNAVPRELSKGFQEEPFLLDLRWAKTSTDLSLKNPSFLEAIATLAATLHGRPRDELVGQDVSQHRLVRNLVRGTIAALSVLTIVAIGAAALALQQRTLTVSRELAATSLVQVMENPELGVLLALEALQFSPTDQAEHALRDTLIKASVHSELKELITATRDGGYGAQATQFHEESVSRTGHLKLRVRNTDGLEVVDSTGRQISQFGGHSANVSSVDFSPDESRIVSVDEDGIGNVWDTRSGRSIGRFQTTSRSWGFASAVWSPDGSYAVIGGVDHTAKVWEAGKRRVMRSFEGNSGAVDQIAISSDSKLVLTASSSDSYGAVRDRSAYIWNARTGDVLANLTDLGRQLDGVAFSPDGALALTNYTDGTAGLWRVKTGVLVLNANGDEFSSSSGLDQRVGTFEAGRYRSSGEGLSEIVNVDFSRNGRFLMTLDDEGETNVWQVTTWAQLSSVPTGLEEEMKTLSEAAADNRAEAMSPDMTRIAMSDGTPNVRVQRWEATAPLNDLIAVAKVRIKRTLTSEERARFISGNLF